MNAVISSRTPEGEPFRCPNCGLDGSIEPSRPSGDAPCPSCGYLLWFPAETSSSRRVRLSREKVAEVFRTEARRPMFGLGATLARSIGRIARATRRLASPRARAEVKPGVYDQWLDG